MSGKKTDDIRMVNVYYMHGIDVFATALEFTLCDT